MTLPAPKGVCAPELIASGLGWPEGPTVLPPDGTHGERLVCVDTYASQITAIGPDRVPRRYAYTAGGPNACVLGSDGALYVCQNGGTTGPWRAKEMVAPSIQRIREGGAAEELITEVAGVRLRGPNDLCFMPDGSLVFSDPGTYNPKNPDPSYIHRLRPDGSAEVVIAFETPVFPNGVAAEPDGSIVWDESYTGPRRAHSPRWAARGSRQTPRRQPDPRRAQGGRRRPPLRDRHRRRRHSCAGARTASRRASSRCGVATTNCVFHGETLWVTDAGVLAVSAEPSSVGQVWKLTVPGGGAGVWYGAVANANGS